LQSSLTADGIRTAAGSNYWLASTLWKILTNEKNIRGCAFAEDRHHGLPE